MSRKILSALAATVFAFAIFAGCSNPKIQVNNENKGFSSSEVSYPLTYTDAYGDVVTIEEKPETIVSVSPAMTEIIYALELEDRLVGRSDYCDYPPEASEIRSVGAIDMPDTEAILEINPDIVLASSIFSEEAYDMLTGLDVTVVIVRDESSVNGMFENITDVATIMGEPQRGEELVLELQGRLNEITVSDAVENLPSVYYCVGFGEYGEFTAGGDTFINDIISCAGARNAAGDVSGWSFSTEALLEANPDYIFIPEWGYDDFINSEPYNTLDAVKNGNVIIIDSNEFERQGPRNVDAIFEIYEAING